MDSCCQDKECELAALRERQGRVLRIVLALNAALFGVELVAGWLGRSSALSADSLDMLGDALVYAFSLWVLGRSARWRNGAALAKGAVMVAFAGAVLGSAVLRAARGALPEPETMGAIGGLALLGNATCFGLLYRHRGDDLNMRSTWLCARNDILANGAVLGTALAVAVTHSLWPDFAVGLAIALLFLSSGISVLRDSLATLRTPPPVISSL
jgi:cation diffusion facilitator family transporter